MTSVDGQDDREILEDDVVHVEEVLVSEILVFKRTPAQAPAASFWARHAVISDRLCGARGVLPEWGRPRPDSQ